MKYSEAKEETLWKIAFTYKLYSPSVVGEGELLESFGRELQKIHMRDYFWCNWLDFIGEPDRVSRCAFCWAVIKLTGTKNCFSCPIGAICETWDIDNDENRFSDLGLQYYFQKILKYDEL